MPEFSPSTNQSNLRTQFVFYQPEAASSAASASSTTPTDFDNGKSRKRGRPKGAKSFTRYLPGAEASKRPIGRPRGSGHRQQAQKEIERQRCENPPSYAGVGLVVPASSPNPSSWDEIMQRPVSNQARTSGPPTPSLSNNHVTLSSVPSASNTLRSSSSNQVTESDHNPGVPTASATSPFNSLISNNILERAQRAATLTENSSDPEIIELPNLPHLPDSFLHLIDLDEDQIIENSLDSLTAEGIGDDDMDIGDDEDDDEYEQEDERAEVSEVDPAVASKEQEQKKKSERPYPTWFSTQLNAAMEQVKADRKSLSGQSRLYQSGTFWFPSKSTWSILQKQNVQPNDLFVPKFFFWDPESLISIGIACPQWMTS
ncbi:hypothetical protein FB446DRAFT_691023, partial [Lentinula raphanica]